jgi:hypothetical protein
MNIFCFFFRNHFTDSCEKSKMTAKTEFKRLPLNVLPINYAVTLKPDLSTFTFDGHVIIDIEVFICITTTTTSKYYETE